MKKLNLIYNHDITDAPYKKSEAKKAFAELENKFGKDVQIFVTHTSNASPNPFTCDSDLIMVEHTFAMTAAEKKETAQILSQGVTKLKAEEPLDVIVSFRKIEEDDLYFFEKGKVE